MAKVKPANLDPGAIPRLKGRFLIRPSEGGWVAQKWPRKRGTAQSWRSKWTSKQWSYAARWAANPEPISYITAIEMTKGTDWVPRDLLMRGIFGTAYQIFGPNGEVYTPNPHRAPGAPPAPGPTPEPGERTKMRCWQWSLQENYYLSPTSSSAYALKGCSFTSHINAEVRAVMPIFLPVIGATYQAHICEIDIDQKILAVTSSDTITATTTDLRPRLMPIAATLQAGKRYAVLYGRNTGSPTAPLALSFVTNQEWLWPATPLMPALLAATTPAIGQTISTGTGNPSTPPFALDIEF